MQVDDNFQSMEPDVVQPQNDLKAMRYHSPVLADIAMGHPEMIRLTPDRCVSTAAAAVQACFMVPGQPLGSRRRMPRSWHSSWYMR